MDLITLIAAKGGRQVYVVLQRFPGRQFTISELAKTSGVPFSTTWLIVRKWERAGIIDTGRVGRAVTVRISGAQPALRAGRLLSAGPSPQQLAVEWLRGRLSAEKRIQAAFLFGSVAAGREGLESDIDVALLAERGFDAAGLASEIGERFRGKLVPLLFFKGSELSGFLKGKQAVRLK